MKEMFLTINAVDGLYKLRKMKQEDFLLVKDFLDHGRESLERKEFFLPYSDEELLAVLQNGEFVGMYDKEKLVGTFAIDYDKKFAKEIGALIRECTKEKFKVPFAYETSGFMLDKQYRGQGLGRLLMRAILGLANEMDGHICGVVHLENIASSKSFLSNGFVLSAVKDWGNNYVFGYFVRATKRSLTKEEKDIVLVECSDISRQKIMLEQGYLGVRIENNCFVYTKYFE